MKSNRGYGKEGKEREKRDVAALLTLRSAT
jgi:hypothetical protein